MVNLDFNGDFVPFTATAKKEGDKKKKSLPKKPQYSLKYQAIPELIKYVAKGDFNSTRSLTKDECLAWFTDNLDKITEKIGYFLPRCHETEEDFLQVAYLSLINAHHTAERKNLPLEGVFWVTFHHDCAAIVKKAKTYRTPIFIAKHQPPLPGWVQITNNVSIEEVLRRMTARQQQVHELLLKGKNVAEAARDLGITKQSAHIIRKQGIERATRSLNKASKVSTYGS